VEHPGPPRSTHHGWVLGPTAWLLGHRAGLQRAPKAPEPAWQSREPQQRTLWQYLLAKHRLIKHRELN